MKNALGYARISDKDQSNFSLAAQSRIITEFCEKNNFTLRNIFTDDGRSAKNFDRAEWRKLEKFIHENHQGIDLFIVVKYDRFSRNLHESLGMIKKIEERFKIEIISINEPIPVKRSSPMFFQIRSQYLVGAQVEWMIIRERTKEGIHNANLAGRYLSRAPLGYINTTDQSGKPLLYIHNEKSRIIKEIYNLYLTGVPPMEIYKIINRDKKILYSRTDVRRILTNPVYAGMVRVKAWEDQPEKLVKGVHKAIIPEADWWRAQDMINVKPTSKKVKLTEKFPLRGVLHCECGHLFTSGQSKGKPGYYFHISNHRKHYNANIVHDKFNQLLQHLSLPETHVKRLQEIIQEKIKEHVKRSKNLIDARRRKLYECDFKLESINEKFILNEFDAKDYHHYKEKYTREKELLLREIKELQQPEDKLNKNFLSSLHHLTSVRECFNRLDLSKQQVFINMVFEHSLSYAEDSFRTAYLMPLFRSKELILKELRLLEIIETNRIKPISNDGAPSDSMFELLQLRSLLSLIAA